MVYKRMTMSETNTPEDLPHPQMQQHVRRKAPPKSRIMMISTHGYVAANPPLGNPDTGGQVVYVLELSKKLAQLGYAVDIWTRRFEDQPEIEEVEEDVRILRMPCGGSDFLPKEYLYKKLPEWGENALRFINRENLTYDFINSHYWDAGLAGSHLALKLQVPHIHTPHSVGIWKKEQMEKDSDLSPEKMDQVYNFSRRIHHENILYRECDLLIATSPIQVDVFLQKHHVNKDKLRMIPPGYDDNRFFPVSEATRENIRQEFGYEGKVVASLGRLSHNKGFDLLIDAFAIAAEHAPEAHLRLAVGTETDSTTEDPILAELFKKVNEHGLQDRVTITGSIPDEEMPAYYQAADVFCLPSRYEPFGMTAVEAMACGTPSVITTRGGLYRTMVYGSDAIYADSLDKYDYGYSILKVLRYKPIRRALSHHGAIKVRSRFTWTGIAQQLISEVEQRGSSLLLEH